MHDHANYQSYHYFMQIYLLLKSKLCPYATIMLMANLMPGFCVHVNCKYLQLHTVCPQTPHRHHNVTSMYTAAQSWNMKPWAYSAKLKYLPKIDLHGTLFRPYHNYMLTKINLIVGDYSSFSVGSLGWVLLYT